MKKILVIAICVAIIATSAVFFVGCNRDKVDIKIGLICLHDNNSAYDRNFLDAFYEVMNEYGFKSKNYSIITGVPEGNQCKEKAVELAEAGCDVIFANSFGHEEYLFDAAVDYPDINFCHATGNQAANFTKMNNVANAFASIHEGRYLAGIAAGMKLLDMYDEDNDGKITDAEAKIGYVGAFQYAEVISGYTAFYLGVKSVVENATMEVQFTGTWYDFTKEKTTAENLISRGCKLISQHADSAGAPTACEEKGVPNVSYNVSMEGSCPKTYLISCRINWAPYFRYMIDRTMAKEPIKKDWVGDIDTGSVIISTPSKIAAPGTAEAIEEAKIKLINGEIHVFDTANFTVHKDATTGKNKNATIDENFKLLSYMADVRTDSKTAGDTQVVESGIFKESQFRAAPYFDVQIDGITLL